MNSVRRVALILGSVLAAVLSVGAVVAVADEELSANQKRAAQAEQGPDILFTGPYVLTFQGEDGRFIDIFKFDHETRRKHKDTIRKHFKSGNWEALEPYGELTPKARQLMAEGRVDEFIQKHKKW